MKAVRFCKQKTAYEMRISDWSSDVALPICFSNRLAVNRACGWLATSNHSAERSVSSTAFCPVPTEPRSMATMALDCESRSSSKIERATDSASASAGRSEERRVGKECVSSVDLGGRSIRKKKRRDKWKEQRITKDNRQQTKERRNKH